MLAEGFPPEDTKMQAMQTMTQGGGPCATALVAAARLGVSAAWLLALHLAGRLMWSRAARKLTINGG